MDEVTATLQILLMPEGLGLAVLGYLIGCVGGAMIGIGGAMTTALVIPFTLVMPPEHAMIILIGVYAGVSYAASIPAILINTPVRRARPPVPSTATRWHVLAKRRRRSRSRRRPRRSAG